MRFYCLPPCREAGFPALVFIASNSFDFVGVFFNVGDVQSDVKMGSSLESGFPALIIITFFSTLSSQQALRYTLKYVCVYVCVFSLCRILGMGTRDFPCSSDCSLFGLFFPLFAQSPSTTPVFLLLFLTPPSLCYLCSDSSIHSSYPMFLW